jgi:hypothetical protein
MGKGVTRLNLAKLQRYRQSLQGFLGYLSDGQLATLFGDAPAWEILGALLQDEELLNDFLSRYRKNERDRRRHEVKFAIALWLAELASHDS